MQVTQKTQRKHPNVLFGVTLKFQIIFVPLGKNDGLKFHYYNSLPKTEWKGISEVDIEYPCYTALL